MKPATVGMSGLMKKVLDAIAPWGSMLSTSTLPFRVASSFAAASLILFAPQQALGQISAEPGFNTSVNLNSNTFDITGGQLSGTGTEQNLFHSFQQFGLNSGQIANFLANRNIRNILGRVMGGEPSIINGLIQVTGGQSNLYLMNPAGIVFGSGASLNVPASFTATTATSIGFGANWFNAAGANDYAALVGSPTSFAFNVNQPGAIINAGNLSVNGGDLTLLGGTVVNTGNVSAPGRQITVAGVEGGKLVRINQQGMLLSLEVEPLASADTQPGNWALPVQSLPQLLTGGNVESATGITVNSQGQAVLTGSGIQVDSNTGSVTVSGTLDASNKTSGQAGGTVHVLANKIALVESTQVDVSGDVGGGTVLIGGDYQGKGEVPNATQTFVESNVSINADAISTGNGGKVILWADEATRFYGNISARGGNSAGNGGFVEVSGKQNLAFDGSVDVGASAGTGGQLLLDPASVVIGADDTNDNQLDDGQILATDPGDVFFISATRLLQTLNTGNVTIAATNDITVNNDIDASANTNAFDLALTAPLINLNASIISNGGNITFDGPVLLGSSETISTGAGAGNIAFNSTLNAVNGAQELTLTAGTGNITFGGAVGNSLTLPGSPDILGSLSVTSTSATNLTANSTIVVDRINLTSRNITLNGNLSTSGTPDNSVTLSATEGDIRTRNINTSVDEGNGGHVTLSAQGNIVVTGDINAGSSDSRNRGGSVRLSSTGGSTTVGNISTNNDGSIAMSASGNISAGDIFNGNRGPEAMPNSSVTLSSTEGNIVVNTIDAGPGGIDITAHGLFRAVGSFNGRNQFEEYVELRNNPDLISFLEGKGISRDELINSQGIVGIITRDIPVSIIARPNSADSARIVIRTGGATKTPDEINGGRIIIKDGGQPFATGPIIISLGEQFVPSYSGDSFQNFDPNSPFTIIRNESYRILNIPDEFPNNVSGTVGAILIGAGNNSSLYASVQNRPFIPTPSNPGDSVGGTNPGGIPSGTNPSGIPSGTNPSGSASGTNLGNIASSNNLSDIPSTTSSSDTASNTGLDGDSNDASDTPSTDLQLNALTDDSTLLNLSGYGGVILDLSQVSTLTTCHATELRINREGKLELIGSCLQPENEQQIKKAIRSRF